MELQVPTGQYESAFELDLQPVVQVFAFTTCKPCSLYYETRLSLSVFQPLLSLLASIVLATLPLADDETPLKLKREGPRIGLEGDV